MWPDSFVPFIYGWTLSFHLFVAGLFCSVYSWPDSFVPFIHGRTLSFRLFMARLFRSVYSWPDSFVPFIHGRTLSFRLFMAGLFRSVYYWFIIYRLIIHLVLCSICPTIKRMVEDFKIRNITFGCSSASLRCPRPSLVYLHGTYMNEDFISCHGFSRRHFHD